jgi:anti-sigma factor RsiW
MPDTKHIPEAELLAAADGELSTARESAVRGHLAECWACRSRLLALEKSIADFMVMQDQRTGSREKELAEQQAFRARLEAEFRSPNYTGWLGLALAAALAAVVWVARDPIPEGPRPAADLTPGATQSLAAKEVCALPVEEADRPVPEALAQQTFARYAIHNPSSGAYEVDYLISPSLGGAVDVRNLWPQPYREGVWNSRVKDALEDHLRQQVCSGKMDLALAQAEIAGDWIRSYQRHFRTPRPLAAHALFLKDRAWGVPE